MPKTGKNARKAGRLESFRFIVRIYRSKSRKGKESIGYSVRVEDGSGAFRVAKHFLVFQDLRELLKTIERLNMYFVSQCTLKDIEDDFLFQAGDSCFAREKITGGYGFREV